MPAPLMGMPGALFQVDPSRGVLPNGPLHHVALDLGHQEKFPDDLAGLSLEREHMSLAALEVSARIADVDQAVPGNRRRRHRLAVLRVGDRRLPQLLAGLEIEGQHAAVLRAAKQHAVHVGGTSIGRQERPGRIHVRAPVLGTSCGIDRENLELGGADQGVVHHDQSGFKGRDRVEVVRAQDLQVGDILGVDLVERRVTLRRRRSVVTRPVACGRARPNGVGWR